jgi:ABC-type transporter Mla subunit MlaD
MSAEDFVSETVRQARLLLQEERDLEVSNLNKYDANEVVDEQAKTIEELEGKLITFSDRLHESGKVIADQTKEIELHEKRYASAIDLIRRKERDLRDLSTHLLQFRGEVINITAQVRALKDVPVDQLEDAIGRVANALDTAVLR